MSEFKLPHVEDLTTNSKLPGQLTENFKAIEQALSDEVADRKKGDGNLQGQIDKLQERCLTTAVASDYGYFFSVSYFKIYAMQNDVVAKSDSAITYLVEHICSFPSIMQVYLRHTEICNHYGQQFSVVSLIFNMLLHTLICGLAAAHNVVYKLGCCTARYSAVAEFPLICLCTQLLV